MALTFPLVCIYNDKSSGESDDKIHAVTRALAQQLKDDFGPAWRTGAHLGFVPSSAKPPAGWWTLAVLDTADVAGALGYHDLTPDGKPLGMAFAGTDRQYGNEISVTLGHELLEMLGDPYINLSAQAPDGKFYAWEDCDAVEADSLGYQVQGVQLSDFVYPAWFGNGAGKLDQCGHCSSPLEVTPGGYISVFDPGSGQGWTQVQASFEDVASAAELYSALPPVGSRRERRHRGRDAWIRSTFEQGEGSDVFERIDFAASSH